MIAKVRICPFAPFLVFVLSIRPQPSFTHSLPFPNAVTDRQSQLDQLYNPGISKEDLQRAKMRERERRRRKKAKKRAKERADDADDN